MGMYDDIICKYPLPLPQDTKGFEPRGFQTKDLDNALDCYEIREDGTLWLRECEREYTEGNPNGKTWSEKFGIVKETKVWWTHVKLTKSIDIYDYQHGEGEYDYWVEFEIVFIDGVIDKIKLIKFEATNYVPTVTMLCAAPIGELDFSNNPTYLQYTQRQNRSASVSDYRFIEHTLDIKNTISASYVTQTASFEKQTFITKIAIYDEDQNIIGIAKLAKPVRKTLDRDYTFKLKMDF